MGFPEKKILKFNEPKVFAYRADIDELAEFTSKLLNDDNLREEMGKNAREHAVKNFNYPDVAKKIAEITVKKLGLE
jgi:glycosyltransferase involved in cell wall biosynthesis